MPDTPRDLVKVDSYGHHWIIGDPHNETEALVLVKCSETSGLPFEIEVRKEGVGAFLKLTRDQLRAMGMACLLMANGNRIDVDG